jgi:hypothetical protein
VATASAVAAIQPQEVVITLDGKEYRWPLEILQAMGNGASQVQQVRNGKPLKHSVSALLGPGGPCRAVSPPRE